MLITPAWNCCSLKRKRLLSFWIGLGSSFVYFEIGDLFSICLKIYENLLCWLSRIRCEITKAMNSMKRKRSRRVFQVCFFRKKNSFVVQIKKFINFSRTIQWNRKLLSKSPLDSIQNPHFYYVFYFMGLGGLICASKAQITCNTKHFRGNMTNIYFKIEIITK